MTAFWWDTEQDATELLRLRKSPCCGAWWRDNSDNTISLRAYERPCRRCDNGPVKPVVPFSDRLLRLYACAISRMCGLTNHEAGKLDIAGVEQWADGGSAYRGTFDVAIADAVVAARAAASDIWGLAYGGEISSSDRVNQLRAILTNPFRPVRRLLAVPALVCVTCSSCDGKGGWASSAGPRGGAGGQASRSCSNCDGEGYVGGFHTTELVESLAEAAYKERLSDGRLDPFRLGLVADAAIDAGCPETVRTRSAVSVSVHNDHAGGWVVAIDTGPSTQQLTNYRTVYVAEDRKGAVLWASLNLNATFTSEYVNYQFGTSFTTVQVPHPVLSQLRSCGPHYRGLWSLDVLTGK